MKALCAVILAMAVPASAQKLHVKVLTHTVDGNPYSQVLPAITLNRGTANANCGAYGSVANCGGTSSGSTISVPSRQVSGILNHIQMLLLLPDGRSVGVYCNDRQVGLARFHYCKNPIATEMEASFSGEKVKLTWGVGLDGKKKESETYMVGPIYPAASKEEK